MIGPRGTVGFIESLASFLNMQPINNFDFDESMKRRQWHVLERDACIHGGEETSVG